MEKVQTNNRRKNIHKKKPTQPGNHAQKLIKIRKQKNYYMAKSKQRNKQTNRLHRDKPTLRKLHKNGANS